MPGLAVDILEATACFPFAGRVEPAVTPPTGSPPNGVVPSSTVRPERGSDGRCVDRGKREADGQHPAQPPPPWLSQLATGNGPNYDPLVPSSRETGFGLEPVPRLRLYEELVARLQGYIEQAGLEPGDRFPPERELAARLGVSRATLKQAIVVLEVQGILEVRQGDGTYLRQPEGLREPLTRLIERRQLLPEVMEAREALECKLAQLAAQRRTDEELQAIDQALAHMEEDILSGGIGAEGDREFHGAVTRAGKNTLLAKLMESLAHEIHETRVESLSEPGRPPRSLAGHRRIAEAIREGNPRAARRAMYDHLKVVANVRLMRWRLELDEQE